MALGESRWMLLGFVLDARCGGGESAAGKQHCVTTRCVCYCVMSALCTSHVGHTV